MAKQQLRSRTSTDRPPPIFPQPPVLPPIPEPIPDPTPIPAPPIIPPPVIVPEFDEDESGSQEEIEIIDEEIVADSETFVVLADDEEEAEIEVAVKEAPEPPKPVSRNPFMRTMSIAPPRIHL